MENSPFRNYDLRNDGPLLTPAEVLKNEQRWREYLNTVAARKAAYTKARKRVNRAQKKARRQNRR
jgi:hypothetical protein